MAGYEHKGCGPINRVCGGSAGLVGVTRAAVYPMAWYGMDDMVEVCGGWLAAEASRSVFE